MLPAAPRGLHLDPKHLDHLRALIEGVGDPVWACGPTGAALFGFDGFRLRQPFHLLIPRGRNLNRIGHVIHTTIDLEPIDRETVRGIACTSPARTIIDLVRIEPAARVSIAIDSAVRDGGTTETHLHQRIAALRTKGRYGMPALIRIIEGSEITRGGHSWLERRFLELIAEAHLPRPQCQVELSQSKQRIVRVDFHFAGSPLVVEVLGYATHHTREQVQRDTERINALTIDGYAVIQFTYQHITEEPGWVTDQVATALRALSKRL